MATTFIGVDLAWHGNKNHSGIAIATETAAGAALTHVSSGLTSFEAVAEFIDARSTENTVVAIDAPLIVTNPTGRRRCESLISRKFGARHASAHSTNLNLYPGGGPAMLVEMLARRGFEHDLDLDRARKHDGRWIFEVYPHPAQVVLFALPKIISYKKGRVAEKREGLSALRQYLAEVLPNATPAFEIGEPGARLLRQDLAELRGRPLKWYEDLLDAWFCSYLALYLWWWGAERNEMLGDSRDGYIVVPTEALIATSR